MKNPLIAPFKQFLAENANIQAEYSAARMLRDHLHPNLLVSLGVGATNEGRYAPDVTVSSPHHHDETGRLAVDAPIAHFILTKEKGSWGITATADHHTDFSNVPTFRDSSIEAKVVKRKSGTNKNINSINYGKAGFSLAVKFKPKEMKKIIIHDGNSITEEGQRFLSNINEHAKRYPVTFDVKRGSRTQLGNVAFHAQTDEAGKVSINSLGSNDGTQGSLQHLLPHMEGSLKDFLINLGRRDTKFLVIKPGMAINQTTPHDVHMAKVPKITSTNLSEVAKEDVHNLIENHFGQKVTGYQVQKID